MVRLAGKTDQYLLTTCAGYEHDLSADNKKNREAAAMRGVQDNLSWGGRAAICGLALVVYGCLAWVCW